METKTRVVSTTFDVRTGLMKFVVEGIGAVELDTNKVHASNREYAMFYGFKQRIADKAAQSRDEKTGLPASPRVKFAAMEAMVRHFESGSDQWTMRASRGPDEGMTVLGEAIMLWKPSSNRDEVLAKLVAMTKAQRDALMIEPQLRPFVDKVRAEQTRDIDTEELLAGF